MFADNMDNANQVECMGYVKARWDRYMQQIKRAYGIIRAWSLG